MYIYAYNGPQGLVVLESDDDEELYTKMGMPLDLTHENIEFCPFKGMVRWSGELNQEFDMEGSWSKVDDLNVERLRFGISVIGRDSPGIMANKEQIIKSLERGGTINEEGLLVRADGSTLELTEEQRV